MAALKGIEEFLAREVFEAQFDSSSLSGDQAYRAQEASKFLTQLLAADQTGDSATEQAFTA